MGPDTGEESPNLIPVIAGVIAGLIAIAIIIAVLVYYIKRKKSAGVSHIDKDTKSVKSMLKYQDSYFVRFHGFTGEFQYRGNIDTLWFYTY